MDPGQGFSGSESQDTTSELETEREMEIVQFLLEFTVATLLIAATAATILTLCFARRKGAGGSVDA